MAIIVSQIKTTLDQPKELAVRKALSALKLAKGDVKTAKLYKTSVDARHEIVFVSSVYMELYSAEKERQLTDKHANVKLFERRTLTMAFGETPPDGSIIVAGFGPAGMFCALTLCEFGYKPIVVI